MRPLNRPWYKSLTNIISVPDSELQYRAHVNPPVKSVLKMQSGITASIAWISTEIPWFLPLITTLKLWEKYRCESTCRTANQIFSYWYKIVIFVFNANSFWFIFWCHLIKSNFFGFKVLQNLSLVSLKFSLSRSTGF